MVDWTRVPEGVGEPDFANLLAVLRRETPRRPTLFEFFLNDRLHERLAPVASLPAGPYLAKRQAIQAYYRAGYDYAVVLVPDFCFPTRSRLFHADGVPKRRRHDCGLADLRSLSLA